MEFMYDILMLLMDNWLMNLTNFLLVDNWLVELMNYRLMVLMNNVLMMFMNYILMMLMDYVLMMLLYNRFIYTLVDFCSGYMFLNYSLSGISDNSGCLLVTDYSSILLVTFLYERLIHSLGC